MPELELTRTPGDRRLYALEGIGTLRLLGWWSRAASAEADGRSWEFARNGLFRTIVTASDAAGSPVGEFRSNGLKRGGTVEWAGRELKLGAASMWRERYALSDGDRELAVIEGKGWGKRPVKVTVDDPGATDAGLLLFAAFVVRALAEDASSAAGGATAASVAATSG
jgi:hypothetical protein